MSKSTGAQVKTSWHGATATRVIAIGGGKGGVGKSMIAANLSVALAQRGLNVVLADLDLGMANLHTVFGIDNPGPTLQGLLDHKIETLDEALLTTGCPGLSLLPGSGAHLGAANINHAQKQKLIRQLGSLACDVLVIDVGAGMHFNTLDFFLLADIHVLVVTSQLTSLENAYAFLKVALYRAFRNAAQDATQRQLFDERQNGRELESVRDIVAQLCRDNPAYGRIIEGVRRSFGLHVIGNMLQDAKDSNSLHAFSRMINHFLAVDARVLGALKSSKRLHDSVTVRRPLMLDGKPDDSTAVMHDMARALMDLDIQVLRAQQTELHFDGITRGFDQVVDGPLPSDLSRYVRRHERVVVSLPVQVTCRGDKHKATFIQLSLSGALLAIDIPLQAGEQIAVLIPTIRTFEGGSFAATVRNARGDGKAFGIEFAEERADLFMQLTERNIT